jgi:hypothetical protein
MAGPFEKKTRAAHVVSSPCFGGGAEGAKAQPSGGESGSGSSPLARRPARAAGVLSKVLGFSALVAGAVSNVLGFAPRAARAVSNVLGVSALAAGAVSKVLGFAARPQEPVQKFWALRPGPQEPVQKFWALRPGRKSRYKSFGLCGPGRKSRYKSFGLCALAAGAVSKVLDFAPWPQELFRKFWALRPGRRSRLRRG